MSTKRASTKQQILHAAYALFYARGFHRVSVDAIADRAGITKRTIYYHFKSKDDIVAEVLGIQHLHLMQQFERWKDTPHQRAADLVNALFSKLIAWASEKDWLGSGFSRITIELADMSGHPARIAASHHKRAVENWLAKELETFDIANSGDLARQIVLLMEGGMTLVLIHRDISYLESSAAAANILLENYCCSSQ